MVYNISKIRRRINYVTLDSVESAETYYLKNGFIHGDNCSINNQERSIDDFGLIPMKSCDINNFLNNIYNTLNTNKFKDAMFNLLTTVVLESIESIDVGSDDLLSNLLNE